MQQKVLRLQLHYPTVHDMLFKNNIAKQSGLLADDNDVHDVIVMTLLLDII